MIGSIRPICGVACSKKRRRVLPFRRCLDAASGARNSFRDTQKTEYCYQPHEYESEHQHPPVRDPMELIARTSPKGPGLEPPELERVKLLAPPNLRVSGATFEGFC